MTEKITSNQRKQIVRFVEDGIDAMNLKKAGAQRLIENGGEFQTELKKLIKRFSITNQYADEEVKSNYGYLSGYKPNRDQTIELIIADFETQIKVLDGYFNCGTKFNPDWLVKAHKVVPGWVEKFFAQFPWQHIAPTYGEAVQKVLDLIKQTRNGAFRNHCEGQLGPNQLRQSAKQVVMFQKLGDEQKGENILVVPAQFGIRHCGRSVRRTREVMNANEVGLGSFAIIIMLLTHPERLKHDEDLLIDCAGDEFARDAGSDFSWSPSFWFCDDGVEFDVDVVDCARGYCGSVSAFDPQN